MNKITSISVNTAFDNCAQKCPHFELEAVRLKTVGGNTYLMDYSCTHLDKCKMIQEFVTEEQ